MSTLSTVDRSLEGCGGIAAHPASHLTAIVYIDAVGSSIAMSRNEIAALRAIETAVDLFEQHAEAYGGRTLSFTGDGAIAAFSSAASAVTFALAFQDALASNADQSAIRFRTGVHLGEMFEERGRVYGDSVNMAERIQSVTPVGAVCVSDLVYRAVRGRPEFRFEFLGPMNVKNVPEPLEVYRVHGSGTAALMKASPRASPLRRSTSATLHALEQLERPSIAVLPLRNLSGDPGQDFFADGITDDLITCLSRFRGLDVIARGSCFTFRDKQLPVTEVGLQLGARYVAEGSIRRSANRVRITLELSDAVSQRTIWAERYDRPLEDIFEIQDEITGLAVGALSVTIEDTERQRSCSEPPDSLHAYGLALKAQNHLLNYTAVHTRLARSLYERALDMSSRYGRALAGISRTHSLDWRYAWADEPGASLERAFAVAVQSIEADPNDARGYAELGFALLYRKEHERALASYARALSLNPNDANIVAEMADALSHAGRSEESLAHFERAMRLNPFYPDQYLWDMAGAYMKLRRFEEAIDCVQRMNNPAQGRRVLAVCYAHLGRLDEARREAELIRAAHPGFSAESWIQVVPDRSSDDRELLYRGLKMSGL